MTVTVDATKGWARPANGSEWTDLLAGTGIANPNSSWDCTEASGNLADDIGSLTLTAGTTPLYGQAATGWAGTGVAADDNTSDRFVAAAASGPDPSTTSQAWLYVMHIGTEPTAGRVWGGINMGSATNCCRLQFNPSAGTNKLRINVAGTSTDGTSDYAVGDYVFLVVYDRSGSRAKVYSNLDTVTGTYSASVTDGNKGFGQTAPGDCQIMLMAMWSGANAEAIDDSKAATIISKIQSPPSGVALDDGDTWTARGYVAPPLLPRPPIPYNDEIGVAKFGLDEDYDRGTKLRANPSPVYAVPRIVMGWGDDPWVVPPSPFGLEDGYLLPQRPNPSPVITPRFKPTDFGAELPMATQATPPAGTSDPTTLTALQAGSTNTKLVVAIEGYPYLLTDATTTQAITAWTGTQYSQALGGLYAKHNASQSLDPWNALANKGGTLTLSIAPDVSDTFGVDTHKNNATITQQTAAVDADDTFTLNVKSTASFPSSGTIYVGTEAIGYAAKGSTRFATLTRGLYSPFRTQQSGTVGFGHPHSVPTDPNNVQIFPVVGTAPRSSTWPGRWIGMWRHLLDVPNSLLNTRDNALCQFAGKIVSIDDNPDGTTTVQCQHVLDVVSSAVLGTDMWSAEIADGMYVFSGMSFGFYDFDGTTIRTASTLTPVTGAPASNYEIQIGWHQYGEIVSAINAWLAQARADGDLAGTYSFDIATQSDNTYRGTITYNIPGAGNQCLFVMDLHEDINKFLGNFDSSGGVVQHFRRITSPLTVHATTSTILSLDGPLRFLNNNNGAVNLINERGTFVSQDSTLPGGLAAQFPGYTNLGVVIINGDTSAAVAKNGTQLDKVIVWRSDAAAPFDNGFSIAIGNYDPIRVQQFFYYFGSFSTILLQIFYSTGAAGYNHPTYDTLPATLGLSIPGELLGSQFESSVLALPNASDDFSLVITKPIKLSELLTGELTLRFSFLRWRTAHLEFWSWMTPVTGDALEESNKASPASNTEDEQRPITHLDDSWQRDVIKILYNRNLTTPVSGNADSYANTTTVIDRVAIDDAGGAAKVQTINCPNTYSAWFLGSSASVENLLPRFRSIVTYFTRPVRRTRRTIDSRFFEGYSVGDCVLVTDAFARDPDTGQRGVAARPGIIVAHQWTLGGGNASGSIDDVVGQVEIMFLDTLKVGPYVPSALVDTDYAASGYSGGYAAATKDLKLKAHAHSEGFENTDVNWFNGNRRVRIVEIDPSDPAAPLTWDDIVATQAIADNRIRLTTGLAGYDSSKHYRVIFDDYPDDVAGQKIYAFFADDADALVADARDPYQYTTSTHNLAIGQPWTKNADDDPVELPPNSSYGDGVGYDVGTEVAINRLINNLLDFKTAMQAPLLTSEVTVLGDTTHSYVLTHIIPINLNPDNLSLFNRRYLWVAPHAKSSDGTGLVRVTLSRGIPSGASTFDVDRGAIYAETTFTTGTTYATATPVALNIGSIKDGAGSAYVLIELNVPVASGSQSVSCRGLGACFKGPRRLT